MKTFLLILSVLGTAWCQYYDYKAALMDYRQNYGMQSTETELVTRMYGAFQQICSNNTESEVESIVNEIKQCVSQTDVEDLTICQGIRTTLPICLEPVTFKMEECLPEEARSLPKHIMESINSAIGYLCSASGEHILELANPCVRQSTYRLRTCQRRVHSRLQQYQNKIPGKEDICDTLQEMRPCFISHLENSCSNRITRNSWTGIYDAITIPCNSDNEVSLEKLTK